jgi:UDP-glucose 4-epimerase
MFKDKILLITGGTGSFGNAVLKRFIDSELEEIRIFSRDEKKQDDMRKKYNNSKIKFYLGDVRNKDSLIDAVRGVDYIFHAAALKQVPSCEFFPMQAVLTNVVGTDNVLSVAIQENVKKVVCLSTDKAAYPINAMGISKAMMEKVFVAKSRNLDDENTVICGTRYGNVMASRGSVIPLFMEQIKSGKSITITDPNMTRFLMNLDEAVDLVLYAFKNGNQGDIFVQKAPSCTINVLAESICEIFNYPLKIDIIGTRHGEKLYETLLTKEERIVAIDEGTFFRVPSDKRDLNYSMYFEKGRIDLSSISDFNSHNTIILSKKEVVQKLMQLEIIKERLQT